MRCAAPLALSLSLSLTLTLLLDRSAAPAVEQLSLHGPGSQATVRERGVGPGATRSYEVEISPRDRARFLAAELWYTKPRDGPTPDPILMVAQGKAPQVFYSTAGDIDADGDVDGQLATNATFFDERGFLLTRARQFVSVPPAQLEADRWYVTVTNVPVWSSGDLDFYLQLRLSDAPPCQASCSGHGTCGPTAECAAEEAAPPSGGHRAADRGFSASRPTPSYLVSSQSVCTGTCTCEEGWGDVDCAVPVQPLMPLVEGTATPAKVPLSTPTIVKVDVPLGNDPAALAAAVDTAGWRYYSVTVDSDGAGGAVATVSPGLGSPGQADGTTTTHWAATDLPGFISAELQLPTADTGSSPPSPPPPTSTGWSNAAAPAATDGSSDDQGATAVDGCQALLYFKHEDEGFTRLPSHYDFQRYSDPVAFYGGLARFHVDLALREGRYIVGVYAAPSSAAGDGFGTGSGVGTVCPAPAELTVSACPSGNALECRYYALGSGSSQARLFVAMLIAAGLPMLCCMPALLCHAMAWLTGAETGNGDDGAGGGGTGQNGRQYQLIEAPRPGLTSAELAAHTIPIVFTGALPQQLQDEHCSICIAEFEEGEELRQLKCSHFFHAECIDEWLGRVDICPLCKASAVLGPTRPASPGPAPGSSAVGGGGSGDEADGTAHHMGDGDIEEADVSGETSQLLLAEELSEPEPEPEPELQVDAEPEPGPEAGGLRDSTSSTESNPLLSSL
jgi:hypothetical protein